MVMKNYRIDYVDPNGQHRSTTRLAMSGVKALSEFKEPHLKVKGVTENAEIRGTVNDGMVYWSEPQWRAEERLRQQMMERDLAELRMRQQQQNQSISGAMGNLMSSFIVGAGGANLNAGLTGGLRSW